MRSSAVLIVRNEEAVISRCLNSVIDAVDEIVVVDTGSTDDSIALAMRAGARVFHFPWCDDFAAARNFALEQATGDVVLTIDADEYLDTKDAQAKLIEFGALPSGTLGAVEIVNLRAAGDDAAPAIDHTARVFHRAAFRYEGAVHEQLTPIDPGRVTRYVETGLRLIHTGYALSGEAAAAKAHRNIALLRKELSRHPDDEYFHYQLAKAWQSLGRHRAAAVAFQRALRCIDFESQPPRGRLGAVSQPVLTGMVCGCAYALINSGDLAAAVDLLAAHESMAHSGARRADFFHVLGYAHLQRGELDRAAATYRKAIDLPEDVQGTGSFAAWYHLGLIDEARDQIPSAREHYRKSLDAKPDYQPALRRLAELGNGG